MLKKGVVGSMKYEIQKTQMRKIKSKVTDVRSKRRNDLSHQTSKCCQEGSYYQSPHPTPIVWSSGQCQK